MTIFSKILSSHAITTQYVVESSVFFDRFKMAMFDAMKGQDVSGLVVFSVGSLGRLEIGCNGDLDVYLLSGDKKVAMGEAGVVGRIRSAILSLPQDRHPLDEKCLKEFLCKDLVMPIGTSFDDYSNAFTCRLLLLLEGRVVFNDVKYREYIFDIVSSYVENRINRTDDVPGVFLFDDILRFWRTLCVNLEVSSYSGTRPTMHKKISLKFSRLITVFGTVLNLMLDRNFDVDKFCAIMDLTPFQRLAKALDLINDESLIDKFSEALDVYLEFLSLKEISCFSESLELDYRLSDRYLVLGRKFESFIYDVLSNERIPYCARRRLVF